MIVPRDVSDTCGGRAPLVEFEDLSGNVHTPMIECISAYAITQGKGDGVYGAKDPLTRGQIATFVLRTLESGVGSLPRGPSVCTGPTHGDSLDALAGAGIMPRAGCRLGDQVTRTEMAQVVAAALEWADADAVNPPDYFIDDGNHSATVQEAHDQIAHAGVVLGTAPGFFSPDQLLRRDQMATFLARFLDALLDA